MELACQVVKEKKSCHVRTDTSSLPLWEGKRILFSSKNLNLLEFITSVCRPMSVRVFHQSQHIIYILFFSLVSLLYLFHNSCVTCFFSLVSLLYLFYQSQHVTCFLFDKFAVLVSPVTTCHLHPVSLVNLLYLF